MIDGDLVIARGGTGVSADMSVVSKGARTESLLGDRNASKETSRCDTTACETMSISWSGTMRSESLVSTFPGMTVGSVVGP